MDTGQIIAIGIQVVILALSILGSAVALGSRLTRIETKLDSFYEQCDLKHVRVDEKLLERKADINGVGRKIELEITKVTNRVEHIEHARGHQAERSADDA